MPSQYGKLVDLLIGLTKKSRLKWQESDQEGIFQVSFKEHTIRISMEPSPTGSSEDDVVIGIYDNNGRMIDIFRDEDVTSATLKYPEMVNLYEGARRYAMGIDKALDSLLRELQDENDIPF